MMSKRFKLKLTSRKCNPETYLRYLNFYVRQRRGTPALLHNNQNYLITMKFTAACSLALVASASAFAPMPVARQSVKVFNEEPKKGAGGMFDTRDPDAFEHEDPRKSIKAAPSFEEYLKQRQAEGN